MLINQSITGKYLTLPGSLARFTYEYIHETTCSDPLKVHRVVKEITTGPGIL